MTKRVRTPLLADALPALAQELSALLVHSERPKLADQIGTLRIKSRCRCGDDFCATIYTGSGHAEAIELEPAEGMIIVDIDVSGKISEIEILYREEYKRAVDDLFSNMKHV